MKNILNEKPSHDLHGRLLFSTRFVSDEDITGKNVLDIGCGYGWFELNALKRNVNKITGIELSEKDIETAKKNIHAENVEFHTYANEKDETVIRLPFDDEQFDTVVSWEVLEHIPKNMETQFFKEAHRVLKNGGVFYLSTPHRHFFSNLFDPAWFLIGHRHYSVKELLEFGQTASFSVEKALRGGGGGELLAINTLYISKWIFRRPQFFKDWFDKKLDIEYNKEKGFTTVFLKCRKQ
jgi:SAM-dependent methyltransferase